MKGQKLTYYLIIWLIMTVAYSAAVLLYYQVPVKLGTYDSLIFTLVLFGLGFSMWFAIRYMDIGIKNLPELTATHIVLAGLVTFVAIFLTSTIEGFFLADADSLPSQIVQGQAFAGILLYAFMVMIFYFSKYRDSLLVQESKENELQNLLQEAELNLLKTQLNPHFIFNSLNSISSLTVTDPDKAREMVIKLSDFLRYTLGKGKEDKVAFEEELKNVNLFLDIERTRFGNRLNMQSDIDDSILNIKVPILILQPLVENAVKYAVYDSIDGATINLKAFKKGDFLTVEIVNPYDANDVGLKGKGIGLNNVRQRLKLLYGDNSELKIEKSDNLFKCQLLLPVFVGL